MIEQPEYFNLIKKVTSPLEHKWRTAVNKANGELRRVEPKVEIRE